MKCLVCGKNYEDNECPRCGFPDLQMPLGEDLEEARKKVQPMIDTYRKSFLQKVEVGVKIYHWKDENGTLAVDHEEKRAFGSGNDIYGKTVWLDQKFARIPEEKKLPVRVYIRCDGDEREEEMPLPNLQEAQLQEIGISMDQQLDFCMMLRNESGTPVYSEKRPLLR